MEAVVRAALDEHRRGKSAARTGATEGETGTGNQEEHAMEYEAIRNKNNTRRKGIKTKNGVLVTVESERCATRTKDQAAAREDEIVLEEPSP